MIKTLQSLRFFFIMLVVLSHYIGTSFDFGGECVVLLCIEWICTISGL